MTTSVESPKVSNKWLHASQFFFVALISAFLLATYQLNEAIISWLTYRAGFFTVALIVGVLVMLFAFTAFLFLREGEDRSFWKFLVRLASVLIATVSIVFFAFEKRDTLVDGAFRLKTNEQQQATKEFLDWTKATREASCRPMSIDEALKSDLENAGRKGMLCTVTIEMDSKARSSALLETSDQEAYVADMEALSAQLLGAASPLLADLGAYLADISRIRSDLSEITENKQESAIINKGIIWFVILFSAGAGLEFANEHRHFNTRLRNLLVVKKP